MWNDFINLASETFLNHQERIKYQIYIAKPQITPDPECDDRLVNVLAENLALFQKNEVHLLSNDKYRSLGNHYFLQCKYDLLLPNNKFIEKFLNKPNVYNPIKKWGFAVSLETDIITSSSNILCCLTS